MEELRDIFPKGTKVLFGENPVEIKTFPINDIDLLADMFENIFDKLKDIKQKSKDKNKQAEQIIKIIVQSMKENKEPVYALIHSSTGLDTDKIPTYSFEAILFLLKHIVKENLDFFESRVFPMVEALFKEMNQAGEKVQKVAVEKQPGAK